ncbi:stem-specific protein TSJT1 isoform X1 [Arachis hypogaea]|uniref:stem-specific protein TSJT1 isoform X1 n=1 Tax=Arachis hypogaea TaxID=3818 RepID=UPI000DED0CB6|nr:stem-specific protein TSJT1 isoform X1 [Arachis hypogaea]
MLGVFSSSIVSAPEELVAAGSRTPSPKSTAETLVKRFVESNGSAVSVEVGDDVQLAYSHHKESPWRPSLHIKNGRSFAVKDEIFCVFSGVLENLGSLRQQYGLAKSANEVVLVIEAYKALRDRAPYPPNHVVSHLSGAFAFILFDKSTSTLFVASDQDGKAPLYWGITADGYVAFADDADLLKRACGKSLASFPQGCFYSTAVGGLRSYENPNNKITAVLANEDDIWGATFKVEGPAVVAATQ